MNRFLRVTMMSVPALLIAGGAEAHIIGLHQPMTLAAGLAHPFLGPDHLIAMLGAGVFAGRRDGGASWRTLLVVLAAVGAGMLVGVGGVLHNVLALGMAASGLLVGLALLLEWRFGAPWLMVAAVVFGLIHGHMHGAAMTPVEGMGAYAAGLLASTGLLLAAGAICGAAGRAYPSVGETAIRTFVAAVSVLTLFLAVT
jgi:urease accessory protein